jgi:hypothetical protein
MTIRALAWTFVLLGAVQGCGGVYYAATVNAASNRVEHAREIGAEQFAPYEYYFAKEHLRQAQVEASEASYSDAAAYAETAEEYANKAIELAQARRAAASEQGPSK